MAAERSRVRSRRRARGRIRAATSEERYSYDPAGRAARSAQPAHHGHRASLNPETAMSKRAPAVLTGLPMLLAAHVMLGQAPAEPARGGLFDSEQVLEIRISTDLKALMDDRDSLKATDHPGTLSYADASGQRLSLDVQLKTRGHWRRQKKNCDFAPIKVDFPKAKDQPAGSVFAGQGDMKLITHCRTRDNTFEQY